MKEFRLYFTLVLVLLTVTLSGCEIIGGIFEAGMWTMLIIIVLIVLLVGWLVRKIRR
ncbi:MAG: hypothetical protein LPK19_02455 [Hymenobacteraceae bacterium]|nr:hypothetical protein [Hymenobacteraceae bacterium]MDX5395044.1 hypothetical protein [Hymenobacteraceae bacterium]MDX5511080.1 hypothetical protein [Hymenobacteraceae bacterium]